ncbi:MAG: helix-turn-helix domain-containing protein [Burkholderiales bacterium]|nr:helix-turn-helix domain-containing protein [Burkholderiales bacterium]
MRGDRTIAARLRSARLSAGWSQERLGVFAGIEEGTVSARMSGYEAGKHTPAPLILERLANALGIPAPYFYAKDDRLAELIRCYGQLSAEGQEKIAVAAGRLVQAEQTKKAILPSKKIPVRRKRTAPKRTR